MSSHAMITGRDQGHIFRGFTVTWWGYELLCCG